ncbi:MAG: hypothetical protein QOG58_3265 [Caballeronia sp.]|jgi:hypothetical protein|nr:hypothetical protein [Caballeronia sp.]
MICISIRQSRRILLKYHERSYRITFDDLGHRVVLFSICPVQGSKHVSFWPNFRGQYCSEQQ